MKVKSFHLGIINLVRQLCIDKQKQMYGDNYELVTVWPSGFDVPEYQDVREAKDVLFLSWMGQGVFAMDTDVLPKAEFYPNKDGLWLPIIFGRPDYYMGAAIGNEAVSFVNNLLQEYRVKPGDKKFGWPVIAYREYAGVINPIPYDKFAHLALTSSISLT